MKNIKILFIAFLSLFCLVGFNSCDKNDESGSTESLIGNTYTNYAIGDPNDEGLIDEEYTDVYFVDASTCKVTYRGFWWIWDGSYNKDYYNSSKTVQYSVSGSSISIDDVDYPKQLTICSGYLQDNMNRIYSK